MTLEVLIVFEATISEKEVVSSIFKAIQDLHPDATIAASKVNQISAFDNEVRECLMKLVELPDNETWNWAKNLCSVIKKQSK